tara:strand:+ start:76 stop:264 length:189 start_codon:yes stop_codon:yes gene_type:complete
MSGNQNDISDKALIAFYSNLIECKKVKPNGSAFKRMQFLQKRIIDRRYKKFITGFKSSNGVA